MTVATIIYYTGLHPFTLKPVYTAKTRQEKKRQHLFFFWHKKENHQIIRDQLHSMGREDLVDKLIGEKKRFNKQSILKERSRKKHKRKFYKKR